MLEHEHGDAAYEFLMRYDEPSSFPFGLVSSLMRWLRDEERRLIVIRRAMEAWRAAPDHRSGNRFISVFQSAWKALPTEEALECVREIVRVTMSQPDFPIRANYDQEQTVTITSRREHTFFTILHILRRLDAPLAESLFAEQEQLAAAARRFPNGMESVMEQAEQRRSASGRTGGGYGMAGSARDFPYMEALVPGSRDGDLGPAIEHAVERYREDAAPDSPNQSPREFWPSTCRFRSILYNAGKRLGRDGAVYLDRIPDDDLRLFAQIEFTAALVGLPE
jgi:hypothetical protein